MISTYKRFKILICLGIIILAHLRRNNFSVNWDEDEFQRINLYTINNRTDIIIPGVCDNPPDYKSLKHLSEPPSYSETVKYSKKY